MNFAEQLRRAEQLAKIGSLVIINPPSNILISEPNNPEAFPDSPVYCLEPNGFELQVMDAKPTEEFAREYLAAMMGWPADKITNITITKNGMGWGFNGNLIVDKPRTFVRYSHGD